MIDREILAAESMRRAETEVDEFLRVLDENSAGDLAVTGGYAIGIWTAPRHE